MVSEARQEEGKRNIIFIFMRSDTRVNLFSS